MPRFAVADLDPAMDDLRGALTGGEDAKKPYNEKFKLLRGTFNPEAAGYCLEKFVSSEMDFHKPGSRGLGRLSDHPPRLGAYFRKQISNLPDDSRSKLSQNIQDLILRGYLSQALFAKEFVVNCKYKEPSKLYKTWVPAIYSAGGKTPDGVWNIMWTVGENAYMRLKDFLAKNNMTGGGFLSKDKTEKIIKHYLLAGWLLRGIEARGL